MARRRKNHSFGYGNEFRKAPLKVLSELALEEAEPGTL